MPDGSSPSGSPEIQLRKEELEFEKIKWAAELGDQRRKTEKVSPVTASILVAAIGIFGTGIGTGLKALSDANLERQRFESQLILKAVETGDTARARENLRFLSRIGLLRPELRTSIDSAVRAGVSPVLPAGGSPISLEPGVAFTEARVDSSNYRNPGAARRVTEILIAETGINNGKALVEYLRRPEVRRSYHYLIDRDGTIRRLVPEDREAFAAGRRNRSSISIGLVHTEPQLARSMGVAYEPMTQEEDSALIDLAADIADRYGIPTDSIRSKSEVDPKRRYEITGRMGSVRERIAARRQVSRAAGPASPR